MASAVGLPPGPGGGAVAPAVHVGGVRDADHGEEVLHSPSHGKDLVDRPLRIGSRREHRRARAARPVAAEAGGGAYLVGQSDAAAVPHSRQERGLAFSCERCCR